MTNVSGAGIVLEYRFRDSFCFHIRLAELLGEEMPGLIERLKIFHGVKQNERRSTLFVAHWIHIFRNLGRSSQLLPAEINLWSSYQEQTYEYARKKQIRCPI